MLLEVRGQGKAAPCTKPSGRERRVIPGAGDVRVSPGTRIGHYEILSQSPHRHTPALERAGETRFLVMVLVPGETLAETLLSGPMALGEARSTGSSSAGDVSESPTRGFDATAAGVVLGELLPLTCLSGDSRFTALRSRGRPPEFSPPAGSSRKSQKPEAP
jgi:hypothetical protein